MTSLNALELCCLVGLVLKDQFPQVTFQDRRMLHFGIQMFNSYILGVSDTSTI